MPPVGRLGPAEMDSSLNQMPLIKRKQSNVETLALLQ